MLKFCSLYSGSSGNSFLIQSDETKILVDAGVSCKKIVEALASLNITIEEIDGIFVTHEHTDHTQSIGTISKKYGTNIFANKKTWKAMPEQVKKIPNNNMYDFSNNENFKFKDLEILPFSIPHDAANPCGFSISKNSTKISITTDIGHMDNYVLSNLKNSQFVLLESNYEPEVLKYSRYPYRLKERIASPLGHLSNIDAGKTLNYLADFGLENAVIAHLSNENNFPELAYKSVFEQIDQNKKLHIEVASRNMPGNIFEVC